MKKNKSRSIKLIIDGEPIDLDNNKDLLNMDWGKRERSIIIDQRNPLLERAKKVLEEMKQAEKVEEEVRSKRRSLISVNINVYKN